MRYTLIILTIFLISCAPSQYQKQLGQLPEAQRDNYRILKYSIEALGTRAEIEEFKKIPSTDSVALRHFEDLFWKKRDPNPLTPENEKKIEFDKRLQYVLENFHTNQFFKPWDERGDTYLKLGPPSERHIRESVNLKEYHIRQNIPTQDGQPIEVLERVLVEDWVYIDIINFGRPLAFVFQPDIVRGYISVPESTTFDKKESLRQQAITWVSQVEQKPMRYFYDYGKEELKYAFGLTPFLMRETPNIYDIYLTINAPAQKLVTPSLDSLRYTWKVLVQDENYERLFEDSSEGISYLGSKNGELKNLVIIDQKELNLKAGTYIITSELVNSDRNKGGLLQSKLVLPPYRFPKEIELSKAILAKEVRVADSLDFKFVRNGLVIKPWVNSIFNPAETFWLYFEIYNMPLDREGKSHFTVRYYLQDLLSKKKYLVSERSVRQEQKDYAIVQSFSDSLFQAAKVSVATGKDYVILAEIKDEILGKEVRSLSAMFKFKKPG